MINKNYSHDDLFYYIHLSFIFIYLNIFMKKVILITFFILTLYTQITVKDLKSIPVDFQIIKSERTLLLNDKYPLETNKITLIAKLNGPSNFFYHVVPSSIINNIADITFQSKKVDLKFQLTQMQGSNVYKVIFDQPLRLEQQKQIIINTRYINRYRNLPSTITLEQDQLLQFSDYLSYYSPYLIQLQISIYKFAKIIQYTAGGVKQGLTGVKYTTTNIEKFNNTIISVHGLNNQPQMLFTNVEKVIQVSHWGNIAINQKYKAVNTGPSLKGEFSRVEYNEYNTNTGKNSLRKTSAILPYEAWGLYYQDEVGNISTSSAYRDERAKHVRFEIKPRFGLLGGWKSNWEIGYNLPTKGFLFHEDKHFTISNLEFGYQLDKIIAEKYSLKIILPQGATNIKVILQGKSLDYTKSLSFSYLDFTGRPTLLIQREISSRDIQKSFMIKYDFETKSLLKKPLLIFSAFLIFFLIFIIGKRITLKTLTAEQHSN